MSDRLKKDEVVRIMKIEKIIIKIIKETGLSRQEIFEMMNQKRLEFNSGITKATALIEVANELAVSIA